MKKNNTPDTLTLCAAAAIKAGMSYGKYMAKYGWNPPIMRQQEPEEREDEMIVCPECGKRFKKSAHGKVYCSMECLERRSRKIDRRKLREKKAAMAAINHE